MKKQREYPLNSEQNQNKEIFSDPQIDFSPFEKAQSEAEISITDIKQESEKHLNAVKDSQKNIGLFTVQTAAEWIEEAKARPIPKMLFGEFWFEGELCILFADTNLGKSVLAVQIADSISKGKPIKGFQLESARQKVLYFDFELSDKQFETRYSCKYQDHYQFDEYFLRAEISPENAYFENYEDFESYLNHSLEWSIKQTGAKILTIDNLTYLKSETERAKHALPLMKHLKALKNKYGLSILALAHTPKRDLSKPITRNDLQGSKMLINFCDSAFAIGESFQDKSTRYLKQIKTRNTENIYDSENVCLCQLEKPHNFLGFEFLDFGSERDHLRTPSDKDKEELERNVKELLDAEAGLSAYAIAKRLCPDDRNFNSFKVKISRVVKKLSNR